MKIKNVLKELIDADRKKIMYAFQNNIACIIELGDGCYIGVYTNRLKYVSPETEEGVWSYGRIKERT